MSNFASTSSPTDSPYSGTDISTDASSPATSTSPGPYHQQHPYHPQHSPSQPYSTLKPHPLSQSPIQHTQSIPSGVQHNQQLDSYTQALQIQAQQQAMATMRNRSISPPHKVTPEEMARTLGWGGIQQLLGDQGGQMSLDMGMQVPAQQQQIIGSPVQSTVGLQYQQQQFQQSQQQYQDYQQQNLQRRSLSPQFPLHHVAPPTAPPQTQQQPTYSFSQQQGGMPTANTNGLAGGMMQTQNMQRVAHANGTGNQLGTGSGLGQGQGVTVKQEPIEYQTNLMSQRQAAGSASTSPVQPPPKQQSRMPTIPQPNIPNSGRVSMPASRSTSVGIDGQSAAPTPSASDKPQVQSRSEPPRRLIDVDFLPVNETPLDQLKTSPERNRLMLQGDPQIITKQRVETAIRVIIDLLRSVPLAPNTPPLPPALSSFLPADPTSTNVYFERPSTFKGLLLQAGTTTKAIAKKQMQAAKTAPEEVLYLETAVYMSGENGKRVYACKRCRLREERRRANKDAARKKQVPVVAASEAGPQSGAVPGPTFPPPAPVPGAPPPSVDYITGENAEQYDPHIKTQVVEEPHWDPTRPDWRHDIVLFNSSPEVPIKDGSCFWLPFRVVCYGKCHGEKVGFRIKFTLRTADGVVVATSFTEPIRITDDHKTDTKAKPKVDGMTSTQPAVPRGRKARASASAASSRRQSPAPSESESVQSMSEAGAVLQKQTPSVRNKPYERPPSQSPASAMQGLPDGQDRPRIGRQMSSSSVHSLTGLTLSNNGTNGMDLYSSDIKPFDQPINNTVSPGALRRPNFGFTSLNGMNQNYQPSAPHSATSSNVASPISGLRPLADDMLMLQNGLPSPPTLTSPFGDMSALGGGPSSQMQMGYGHPSVGNQMLSDYLADQDMAHTMHSAMDNLFDVSSHASLASSFGDGASTSAFSGYHDGASGFYSDSGLVPEDTSMEGFLDFSGGQDQSLAGPPFGGSAQSPYGLDMDNMSPDPIQAGSGEPGSAMMGYNDAPQAEIQDILSSLSRRRNDPNSQSPNMGMLHHPLSPVASMASPTAYTGMNNASFSSTGNANTSEQSTGAFAQQEAPIPPQPLVSHVIPAEGPMAGGTQVAIAGQRFAHGMTIMFGTRIAKTTVVSDSFCTCELPPAAEAGLVDVAVQGAIRRQGDKVETFRYLGMDKEMMRLALEVRDQYQGSSSAAAYRLAQRVAQSTGSTSNSESERSSASPMGSGASPNMFKAPSTAASTDKIEPKEEEDLQLTIINFLSSLDKHAPGSFRRSGTVNHRNSAQQTLLHLSVVMGFHRLVRRLILMGAQLDLQDANGFTALAFASLGGQAACARVLIEAGAAYDRPTNFGEMPLDLAKLGEREEVEALLLSAVWSTTATASPTPAPDVKPAVEITAKVAAAEEDRDVAAINAGPIVPHLTTEARSEIDDDNPSSSSDVDEEASRLRNLKVRRRKSKGKSRASLPGMVVAPTTFEQPQSADIIAPNSPAAVSVDLATAASVPLPLDDPPPYEPSRAPSPQAPLRPLVPNQPSRKAEIDQGHQATWMERTLSNISDSGSRVDTGMWSRLPLSSFWADKAHVSSAPGTSAGDTGESTQQPAPHGWIALPAPSWETLSKLTSPEEVKLFTQAMAAAALSAVVQSTGGTLDFGESSTAASRSSAGLAAQRRRKGTGGARRSSQSSSSVTPTATGNASGTGEGNASGTGKKDRVKARRSSGKEGEKEKEQVKNMVKHVKQDRMLYLFWLPILLFVGFWLLVTALPIATGFGLIYARQITKAIKQRM